MDTMRTTDPVEAARLLVNGHVVNYEPGDATRYECALVDLYDDRRFLAVLNFNWIVELRDRLGNPAGYVADGMPRGTWRALRPLLLHLGLKVGGPASMIDGDADLEAEARRR